MSRAQLAGGGSSGTGIARDIEAGRLHRIHPGVYAVGHGRLAIEGRLAAALLYGGDGAMLSHVTAAWWWGIWGTEPREIHITVPGRRRSIAGVKVHRTRTLEGTRHRGLPVTTMPRTLANLASGVLFDDLRKALAEADYRKLIDLDEVRAQAIPGRLGGANLRRAISRHLPQLAETLSVLEGRFLALCETHRIPMPEVNTFIDDMMVDNLWRRQRVVVELDGHKGHAHPVAVERDRQRELRLRAMGYLVLRYTWHQVTGQAKAVAADLQAELASRSPPDGMLD